MCADSKRFQGVIGLVEYVEAYDTLPAYEKQTGGGGSKSEDIMVL